MNVLFFLKPKNTITYIYDDFTLRQALEEIKNSGFTSLPVINREGEFVYTISADDILFDILSRDSFSMLSSENIKIDNVRKRRIFNTISVNNDIEDLISISLKQNYIPVVDDRNKFIGIITRQDIIKHFYSQLK
jgi:CBS domain-containing protein